MNAIIEQVIRKPHIQNLLNEDVFHFQKLLDVKEKFEAFEISDNEIDELIELRKNSKLSFEDFINSLSGQSKEFIDLMGDLIAYLDKNAAGIRQRNQYSDNRAIAKAFVRQNVWVDHLLKLKKDSKHRATDNIQNALKYANNPDLNFNILSSEHRKEVIENLCQKKYQPEQFNQDLTELFKPYSLTPKNSKNRTHIIACIIYDEAVKKLWKSDKSSPNTIISNDETKQAMALNQILFGPPGTGKTYFIQTKYAVDAKIESNDLSKPIVIQSNKNFWHLAPGAGASLWNDLKEQNYLGYEWCDKDYGDLKKLSRQTESHSIISRFSKVKKGDYFCIISGKKFFAIAEAKHDYDLALSGKSTFDFQTIEVDWIKQFDKPELLNSSNLPAFSNLNGGKRWNSLIEALSNQNIILSENKDETVVKNPKNYVFVSFHQSFGYEDFIEGIKPTLSGENTDESDISYTIEDGVFKTACDKAARLAGYEDLNDCIDDTKDNRKIAFDDAPPFYILIDEINRGNIAAIFGELITLIEPDKRLGKEHEIMVELPYSKSDFGVPANLHIIGTMNTADRSVEALDTALRRRFSFVEMLPKPDLLEGTQIDDIDVAQLLKVINQRIELLLDKNHTIGHSYFLNINSLDELKTVFANKVIPLLEEYFYGDFGKIGLILGNSFVTKTEDKNKISFADFDYDDRDILRDRTLYEFTPQSEWDFTSIYNKPDEK